MSSVYSVYFSNQGKRMAREAAMFEAWGRALAHKRRLGLASTLLFVVFAGLWGTRGFGALSSGDNFTPPGSPSQQEASQAAQAFGRNDADVVVLYRSTAM